MIRVALKGLLGRKLRTSLTAIAIVLGVAMVAGTFMLTDSIDNAFNSIFTDVRKGSNAVISGKTAFDISSDAGSTAPTLDASLLGTVRGLPDVEAAEGSVNGQAQLIGKNGKAIVYGGAPNLGFSIANGASRFNPLTLVDGSWPQQGDVVIDESTANKEHLTIGHPVRVQAEGAARTLRISGFVRFGSVSTIGGATLAGFDLPTAQKLFKKSGRLDEIAVAAKPGVTDDQLVGELQGVLPATAQVKTSAQQAKDDASETNSFISFLRGFLLAFGGIALFVGSFVIANSLSITIAQRTREFATLRTVGASRRQILTSIMIEALVMGVLASLVGLAFGVALAKGLFALFDAVGFTLPNSGLILTGTAVAIALAAGIVVTLLASLRPALRATRVPPLAAVREGATLPKSRFAFLRLPGSIFLTILGFAALSWSLFGPGLSTTSLLVWMGVGALMIFLGVALLAERLVRPLATLLGWPAAKLGGAAGVLARENTQRNPQRTASTASALMIGLALVTLVTLLAAGIVTTFKSAVDDLWKNADYAVTAQNNFSPIPVSVAAEAAKAPGVDAVGSVRAGQAKAFGSVFNATAVDPRRPEFLARLGGRHRRGPRPPRQRRRLRRQGLRGRSRPEGRLVVSRDLRQRTIGPLPGAGHLQAADGRIAVRAGHDLGQHVGSLQRPAPEPLLVRDHEGRRDGREQGCARPVAAPVPEREGADEAGVRRQPDLRAELGAQHPVRPARALGPRQLLRDREHARPDGLRADA